MSMITERKLEDDGSRRIHLEKLLAERNLVFSQWLEASKAWSSSRLSAEEAGKGQISESQNLQGLEKQIASTAEAFGRLQDKIRDLCLGVI